MISSTLRISLLTLFIALATTGCGSSGDDTGGGGEKFVVRDFGGKIPILVSSFEPMSGRPQNNSEFIAELLPEYQKSFEIIPCPSLPVQYDAAAARLIACFEANQDVRAVISLGESDDSIEIEQYAMNLDSASISDNAGVIRHKEVIVPGGPQYLPLSLAGGAIFKFSTPNNSPVRLKYDNFKGGMGNFVANNLAYRFATYLKQGNHGTAFSFIHVPHAMSPSERHSPYEVARALGHLFEKGLRPMLRVATEI